MNPTDLTESYALLINGYKNSDTHYFQVLKEAYILLT